MADHWLDVIPVVPLARGVPSRHPSGGRVVAEGEVRDPGVWRIDLGDPQGMAYALRHCPAWFQGASLVNGLVVRMWADLTTDADRLAVARALAEVAP